jgi:hypothetical protein
VKNTLAYYGKHGLEFLFVVKARSLPNSGSLETGSTKIGSSLTWKHKTKLERLTRDKHSSLLGTLCPGAILQFFSSLTQWQNKLEC